MAKQHKRGKNKGIRHVRLEHWLLNTPAWRSLTPADRVVYIELCKRYNGSNNGGIAYSNRDAATDCRISKNTAGRCFIILAKRGFIKVRTQSAFSLKTRLATEYELTEYQYLDRAPTKEFRDWMPCLKKNNSPTRDTDSTKIRTPKENIPRFQVVGGSDLVP